MCAGEIHSKNGNEPTGKMTVTRVSYDKPKGGETTVRTKTSTRTLNSKENVEITPTIAYSNEDESWKSSKLNSSSLIRKISNERFEKAQRKFSGSDDNSSSDSRRNSIEKCKFSSRKSSVEESSFNEQTVSGTTTVSYESKVEVVDGGSNKSPNKFQQVTGEYFGGLEGDLVVVDLAERK